ncbi:ribonuclease VapC37 [Mycobacterium heckeshornense]|uniref:Ribonuclease VapC37 n=1 Tax=Mycobacterium heckeshornense TaxID=110505 RepID=A0A7R7GYA7_9MYCO|nr:ribonuclease VapC37 [Mycobacterium heckeshornense]
MRCGGDTVGLARVPLLAFVRLTTRHGLFPSPLSSDVLAGLLSQVGAGANLVNDAHLAALAVEHRARTVSYDSDFGRFDGVRWETPESSLT